MKAPELDVRYVARLARLELSEQETAQFQSQLTDVLGYIATLDRLDVAGLATELEAPEANVTRPDAARPGLSTEEALANAPASSQGSFLTVRVVE